MELDQLGQPTMFIRIYKIQGTQRVIYTCSSSPPYRFLHLLLLLVGASLKPGLLNVVSLRNARGNFCCVSLSPLSGWWGGEVEGSTLRELSVGAEWLSSRVDSSGSIAGGYEREEISMEVCCCCCVDGVGSVGMVDGGCMMEHGLMKRRLRNVTRPEPSTLMLYCQ